MPIFESEKLSYDQLKHMAASHKCQCGANLTLAFGGAIGHNCYMLRCANNIEHSDFVRPATIKNYDLPGSNMPGVSNRKERELVTKYGEETTKALVRAAGGNALSTLTEKAATSMAMVLWPEACKCESGKNAIAKLALICRDYGLNPAMDHVFLVKFDRYEGKGADRRKVGEDWTVVRGIKASRLICGRDRSYGYIDDTPRIMTEEEQKRIFGEIDATSVVTICKLRDKDGNVFTGYGKWSLYRQWGDKQYDNNPQGVEKGNSKFNMSCIRAERQALDKLNPGSMPAIDVVDENYIPKPKIVITSDGTKVDSISGEIKDNPTGQPVAIEGSYTEGLPNVDELVKPDPEWDKLERKPEAVAKKEPEKKMKAPSEIKSFGDLYKTCMEQWPTSFPGKVAVLKEAGFNSQEEATQTPADIYAAILKVRTL